jgi:hypothetical protein
MRGLPVVDNALLLQGVEYGTLSIETGFSRLSGLMFVLKSVMLDRDVTATPVEDTPSLTRLPSHRLGGPTCYGG